MRERKRKRSPIDWTNEAALNVAELGDADQALVDFSVLIGHASTRAELLQIRASLFRSERLHVLYGDPFDSETYMDLLGEITHRIAEFGIHKQED